MDNIVEPSNEFDFSQISLGNPTSVQGGAYFTKIMHLQKPLYIQTPKSLTKQGFVKNAKKYYVELMFDNNDEVFLHWLENLETRCQQLIYEKRDTWFQNQLELNDIEGAFASTIRPYKSCKYYLLRVNVRMNYATNLPMIKIYNDNETQLSIEDITSDTNIISIVEIQGIKFTSRSFQIDMEVKQMMTLNTEVIFESCLIKSIYPKKTRFTQETFQDPTSTVGEVVLTEHGVNRSKKDNEKDCEKDNELYEKAADDTIQEHKEHKEQEQQDQDQQNKEQQNKEQRELEYQQKQEERDQEQQEIIEPSIDLSELSELKEFDISEESPLESITLKKPNQVYYEIYKEAKKKAKQAKKEAILAFLEMKNIKQTYMIDNLEDSESDEDDLDLDNLSEYSDTELESKLES